MTTTMDTITSYVDTLPGSRDAAIVLRNALADAIDARARSVRARSDAAYATRVLYSANYRVLRSAHDYSVKTRSASDAIGSAGAAAHTANELSVHANNDAYDADEYAHICNLAVYDALNAVINTHS